MALAFADDPAWRTMRAARQMTAVFGRRLPLALRTQLRLERHHPRQPHHWYLHYIGIEPRHQGRGLGAALMAPVLARCDEDGTPAHLEASTERNRVLYERHGFGLTGSFDMPGGARPCARCGAIRAEGPATGSA